jgi:16S rRNA U516 pseudouridylate synthase RsuA-like enzyme
MGAPTGHQVRRVNAAFGLSLNRNRVGNVKLDFAPSIATFEDISSVNYLPAQRLNGARFF